MSEPIANEHETVQTCVHCGESKIVPRRKDMAHQSVICVKCQRASHEHYETR